MSGKLGVTGEASSEPSVPLQSSGSAETAIKTFTETINKIWAALGIETYEQANGKTIWEIVAEMKNKHHWFEVDNGKMCSNCGSFVVSDCAVLSKTQCTSSEERSDTELPAPMCQPDNSKFSINEMPERAG